MPDNLLGAFQLTIIDMAIVFAVLYVLTWMIKGIKIALDRLSRPKEQLDTTTSVVPSVMTTGSPEAGIDHFPSAESGATPAPGTDLPLETVVAITAALAAYLGGEKERFVIKGIQPLPLTQGAWTLAGRLELMANRQWHWRQRR